MAVNRTAYVTTAASSTYTTVAETFANNGGWLQYPEPKGFANSQPQRQISRKTHSIGEFQNTTSHGQIVSHVCYSACCPFLSRVWLSILKGIGNTRVCSIWQYYKIKKCCIQVISPFSPAGDRFPSLCLLIYNFLNE